MRVTDLRAVCAGTFIHHDCEFFHVQQQRYLCQNVYFSPCISPYKISVNIISGHHSSLHVWYHPEHSLKDSIESVKQNEIHPPIKQMQTPWVQLTRDLCLT